MTSILPAILRRFLSAPAALASPAKPAKPAMAEAVAGPCAVCLEDVRPAEAVSLCGGACEARMCGGCAAAFLKSRAISDSGFACCPRVECPGPCRSYVPLAVWRRHAAPEVGAAYERNAATLLALRCQRCDQTKTLMPSHDPEARLPPEMAECKEAMALHLEGDREAAGAVVDVLDAAVESGAAKQKEVEALAAAMAALAGAKLEWRKFMGAHGSDMRTTNEQFKVARKAAGKLKRVLKSAGEDDEKEREAVAAELGEARKEAARLRRKRDELMGGMRGKLGMAKLEKAVRLARRALAEDNTAENMMLATLETVEDPERRAMLMLKYLGRHPVVTTRCHGAPTCWSCAVVVNPRNPREEHDGGPRCHAYQAKSLPKDVRVCPGDGCKALHMRGDGCSSFLCPVCQTCFSWSSAKLAST